jgi:multisubunit Na+/H+ antiporter MnhB subunit
MFLVAMFIVYFGYMLSIVGLSSYLCLSSYSIHPNVHRVGGRDHVSVVLICYLPMNTLYILSHVVDRGCDTSVESFVVHSTSIGSGSRARL